MLKGHGFLPSSARAAPARELLHAVGYERRACAALGPVRVAQEFCRLPSKSGRGDPEKNPPRAFRQRREGFARLRGRRTRRTAAAQRSENHIGAWLFWTLGCAPSWMTGTSPGARPRTQTTHFVPAGRLTRSFM
jgi:hypothetical protein